MQVSVNYSMSIVKCQLSKRTLSNVKLHVSTVKCILWNINWQMYITPVAILNYSLILLSTPSLSFDISNVTSGHIILFYSNIIAYVILINTILFYRFIVACYNTHWKPTYAQTTKSETWRTFLFHLKRLRTEAH